MKVRALLEDFFSHFSTALQNAAGYAANQLAAQTALCFR
jgi:hypothetical protein